MPSSEATFAHRPWLPPRSAFASPSLAPSAAPSTQNHVRKLQITASLYIQITASLCIFTNYGFIIYTQVRIFTNYGFIIYTQDIYTSQDDKMHKSYYLLGRLKTLQQENAILLTPHAGQLHRPGQAAGGQARDGRTSQPPMRL